MKINTDQSLLFLASLLNNNLKDITELGPSLQFLIN